jgi:hypothetical protein
MSQDMNRQAHSARGDTATSRKLPRGPMLIVAAAFLVPLVLVTVPNWSEFASNLSQFSALWQISGNHQEIINNIIRVCSPLLLAAIAAGCCWLWATVRAYQQELPPQAAPGRQYNSARPGTHEQVRFAASNNGKQALPITPIPQVLTTAARDKDARREEGHERDEDLDDPFDDDIESEGAPEQASESAADTTPIYLTITVLGQLRMTLHVPGGKRYPIPLSLNPRDSQLVAYLAWYHDRTVNLDRLKEHIFGYGKDDEEATPPKLQEYIDSSKKEIRRVVRQAIAGVNKAVGHEVIPPHLDLFDIRNKQYRLASFCRVTDLCAIDAEHAVIQQAFDAGLLVDSIPDYVRKACVRLRKAYKAGDFLADLIGDTSKELGSWVRKPFTQYRDYFLQALLFSAEYHLRAGHLLAGGSASDPERVKHRRQQRQRAHYSQAAHQYRIYAQRACDSRADLKVSFGGGGRAPGERVDMSERALRRFLTLMGMLGQTAELNQVYNNYHPYMRLISAKAWEPSRDTLADLKSAQEQTSAHRFDAMMTSSLALPPSAQVVNRS